MPASRLRSTPFQRYKVLNVLGILPLTSKVTLPVFNSAAPVPVTLTAPPSPNSTATVNATSLDLTKLARIWPTR